MGSVAEATIPNRHLICSSTFLSDQLVFATFVVGEPLAKVGGSFAYSEHYCSHQIL